MESVETVKVKHVLSTLDGIQSWVGNVRDALSGLDHEKVLVMATAKSGKGDPKEKKDVCPPPEED